MSTPRIVRATQALLHQTSRMVRSFTKGLINWLLRSLLVLGKQPRWTKAGFVLPTTVMLLLVVTLTVGAIGFRTFTRTQQTIGERQQRVIYNAATPAIDRAKAKLEFLFDINRDPRGGVVPPEDTLVHMMLNDGGSGVSPHSSNIDPYTFKDSNPALNETRLDINGGGLDNAWKYRADTNGDGTPDATIAYSIIFKAPINQAELQDTRDDVAGRGALDRAAKLQIRNTPLSNATQLSNRCRAQSGTPNGVPLTNGEGWFRDPVNTTVLRKNFQVDVYVLPDNPNGAIATLEFQQDRQANQGFKWAAWFRNDLEVFPGPQFNWNGAMHTEGNYFFTGAFRGYMISAVESCLYTKDASEITAAEISADTEKEISAFQGQFISGSIRDNNYNGSPDFDLWNGANVIPLPPTALTANSDSIKPGTSRVPADFALDPVVLHTEDTSKSRNITSGNPAVERDPNWSTRPLNDKERMINQTQATPYVDDTFRADNRWGPKPRWGFERKPLPDTIKIGDPISGSYPELRGDDPPPGGDSTSVGLDGYWERRARREGLRLIVGQRLELGDPAGWGGSGATTPDGSTASDPSYALVDVNTKPWVDNEPLRPWSGAGASNTRYNEARQRRTLWDNLASVQATAVYHAAYGGGSNIDFPLACIATTVHPGTSNTIEKGSTFENLAFGLPSNAITSTNLTRTINYSDPSNPLIISDFFRGRGTNGWEFAPPPEADFSNPTSELRKALSNLAQFAGDPKGGTPSFPAPANTQYTPYPLMSMWGDFSMLRRVIGLLNAGTYADLSPADKTTLHTAGCTLGMLAYNLDYLEKLPKVAPAGTPAPDTLDGILGTTAAEDLLGKPGLSLVANPSLPVTPNNMAASKGLRGYIRLINAAIKEGTDPIPDTDRSLQNVPVAIKNLDEGDMNRLAWSKEGGNNPETYVRLMERWRDTLDSASQQYKDLNKIIYLAQLLITREQVARDRTFGFRGTYGSTSDSLLSLAPLGQCEDWKNSTDDLQYLCSSRPRYPILYSLFPARLPISSPAPTTLANAYTPTGFIEHGDLDDDEIADDQRLKVRDYADRRNSYLKVTNKDLKYKVVKPESIATLPRGAQSMGTSSEIWKLPSVAAGSGSNPNSNKFELIKVCSPATPCSSPAARNPGRRAASVSANLFRVPFKDAALYNGRELMSVRTLDLDLDLMRTSATPAGDFWLPKSGIIYAFREDAVSEAHISRPKNSSWSPCDTFNEMQTTTGCQMRTRDGYVSGEINGSGYTNNFDPPISDKTGVTPKPVDFFPDPDRRPYGFRLRNGETIERTGDGGVGLSFITDNPAYVQGSFNLHQTFGTTETPQSSALEEFIEKLNTVTFGNFYTRQALDTTNFAKKEKDKWRPSEVLADAVTPLSKNFCDGSIEDSFMIAGNGTAATISTSYGCTDNGGETSYRNQPRVTEPVIATNALNGVKWMRSNPIDSLWAATSSGTDRAIEGESPIIVHPSGNPMKIEGGQYSGAYAAINGDRDRSSAVETQMNMIMVSGVVPSRLGQSYGGLHNFPRFLENWAGRTLFFSGAFLQLNFSTYATAPFDQESWQPGNPAPIAGSGGNEWIGYYSPPTRAWGYDVGLQYTPAGPVARRFKFSQATRSEFYSEPAASDPYIRNLCRSVSATPTNCP
jgi:hypothetical protein